MKHKDAVSPKSLLVLRHRNKQWENLQYCETAVDRCGLGPEAV
jgi:hypothetical protein